MALFSIGIVMKLTELTARQIRYYEEQGLIKPARNEGNQRVYSLHDIDRLLEIKELIDQGVNIAGIRAVYQSQPKEDDDNFIPVTDEMKKRDLTDQELRQLLKKELLSARTGRHVSLIQGELSRFFNN